MVAELQPVVSRHFKDDSAGGVGAKLATLATQSSTHARPPNIPHVHHATASRVVKGEDCLFVHPLNINTQPQSMMYMVCDGHSGVEAANFVTSNFLRILNTKLPAKMPNFSNTKEVELFAESIRKALCETFVRLDNEWTNVGLMSGTTVTVALSIGWLLTVANTGDSATVLDTGCSILELTRSHRIHSNMEEQARLKQASQHLAPLGFHLQGPAKPGEPGVGPLRLWPGGLCVSRSIGDLDAGPEVVPVPHIRQVILPTEGCRVIMASDGLWDVLTFSKAAKITRSKPTGAAASTLVTAVSRDLRTMDDASIVIIDMLPTEGTSFPTVALKANPKGTEKGGGLFACFKPEADEPDSRELAGNGHLSFFCDVDCLRAYPGLKQLLNRTSLGVAAQQLQAVNKGPTDFTMHGGKMYPAGALLGVPGGAGMMKSPSHATLDQAGMVHAGGSADGTHHSAVSMVVESTTHPKSPASGGLYKCRSQELQEPDSPSKQSPVVKFGSAPVGSPTASLRAS